MVGLRKVILFIATSLDGYIAGPAGEIDWLFQDQDYGYAEFYESVEYIVMGRKTYETALSFEEWPHPGKQTFVFTRTGAAKARADVSLVRVNLRPNRASDLRRNGASSRYRFQGLEQVTF